MKRPGLLRKHSFPLGGVLGEDPRTVRTPPYTNRRLSVLRCETHIPFNAGYSIIAEKD